jgi:hypothetical protein
MVNAGAVLLDDRGKPKCMPVLQLLDRRYGDARPARAPQV